MPNRILKESFKSSPEVDKLSWFEECVWNRLIVTVDDYGRFDGRIAMLKSELFPLKDNVTKKDIESAVRHLEQVGLVRLYTVEDRPYICILKWDKHQQIRAKKSKFPEPENICNQMISDDNKCPRNPIQSNTESESNTNIYVTTLDKPKSSRFTKPTVEEIQKYIDENYYMVDAQKFFDYYESNGWKVGKNAMKDWKRTVNNWHRREVENGKAAPKGYARKDPFEGFPF